MMLVISVLLALVPLLGVAWIVLNGSITTVDGLFMSLILLAMSGIVGLNVLIELRKGRTGKLGSFDGTLTVFRRVAPARQSGERAVLRVWRGSAQQIDCDPFRRGQRVEPSGA